MTTLSDRIIEKLGTYLGQNAARASLSMFLEKNRLDATALGHEHLPQLAQTLKPGLKVFLGAARADAVVKEIEGLLEVSP